MNAIVSEIYTDADRAHVLAFTAAECSRHELGPMAALRIRGLVDLALTDSIKWFSTREGQIEDAIGYARELAAEYRQNEDLVRRIVARQEARNAAKEAA